MNTEKLLTLVALELSADLTKLELELETTINSKLDVPNKTHQIKYLLGKIVQTEASIMKFNQMTATQKNNEK